MILTSLLFFSTFVFTFGLYIYFWVLNFKINWYLRSPEYGRLVHARSSFITETVNWWALGLICKEKREDRSVS
uniref:Uncharacterized protein n=1 Tax=Salix viminalis TaxID=40686 RepID=A0A6N2LUV6_SALVM